MTRSDTRTASLDEIRRMDEAGLLERDRSAPAGGDLGDDFWSRASLNPPRGKTSVQLTLDTDVVDFFGRDGNDAAERMIRVLEAYASEGR